MIAKFPGGDQHILEIEKQDDGISFYVYHSDEEEIGQAVTIPLSEVNNIIKYLQSLTILQ
jgi:hypothetical protein